MASVSAKRLIGFLQPQDLAWAIFVVFLLMTAPERNYDAWILVPLIGVFQIVEPRIPLFQSRRGQIVSVALKLVLCYFLIGFSDTIFSFYYPIFLIPVVSAASSFGFVGTSVTILLAILGYSSYMLPAFVKWLPAGYPGVVAGHCAFYAIIGFLVYQEASAKNRAHGRLRTAEASLRRSERLAALGQLTAGLAHELRNPLATVKASAEMLGGKIVEPDPEIIREMSGYISGEVDRMNALIARFLNFARPLNVNAEKARLRPVMDEVVRRQSESAAARQVAIQTQIEDYALELVFDAELMQVALENLVQNAIQASESGQAVVITAEKVGSNVRITVADHGSGIPPGQLESIFNPFFTTKPNGVGLGLALVQKIVDEHNGTIQVFSEPGQGATFEISIPMSNSVAANN